MFEEIIDEFSFNHPANKGYGKSKKLRQLSSGDPQYTTGKRSWTLIYQRNLTRLKSKGSSIKAGNIRRNQDQRFKEYLWYSLQRRLYHHTSVIGTFLESLKRNVTWFVTPGNRSWPLQLFVIARRILPMSNIFSTELIVIVAWWRTEVGCAFATFQNAISALFFETLLMSRDVVSFFRQSS